MIHKSIEDRLRALGLSGTYDGYFCLVHSVLLAAEDPSRLEYPTKLLYPDVARACGISTDQVDNALRSAIRRCCRSAPEQISLLCGVGTPTVSQFIGVLAAELQARSAR